MARVVRVGYGDVEGRKFSKISKVSESVQNVSKWCVGVFRVRKSAKVGPGWAIGAVWMFVCGGVSWLCWGVFSLSLTNLGNVLCKKFVGC